MKLHGDSFFLVIGVSPMALKAKVCDDCRKKLGVVPLLRSESKR